MNVTANSNISNLRISYFEILSDTFYFLLKLLELSAPELKQDKWVLELGNINH